MPPMTNKPMGTSAANTQLDTEIWFGVTAELAKPRAIARMTPLSREETFLRSIIVQKYDVHANGICLSPRARRLARAGCFHRQHGEPTSRHREGRNGLQIQMLANASCYLL
ncbi:hypothetical protein ACDA63_02045 [Uliginosibacterium sp. sgz301328]|uniref:hypothetical protein n=1 Tax=Uliginosibacterium sp. sgz301328 TaxID=3243764 RepID=UPI00359EAD4D